MICFDRQRCFGFAAEMLGHANWGEWAQAIGYERNGELLAVVIYNNLADLNISMHVVAKTGRRWCVPEFVSAAFRYPFVQLRLNRVTAYVPSKNEAALKLDKHLGFIEEGRIREALDDGDDLIVLGILKREWETLHGWQESQSSAAA